MTTGRMSFGAAFDSVENGIEATPEIGGHWSVGALIRAASADRKLFHLSTHKRRRYREGPAGAVPAASPSRPAITSIVGEQTLVDLAAPNAPGPFGVEADLNAIVG